VNQLASTMRCASSFYRCGGPGDGDRTEAVTVCVWTSSWPLLQAILRYWVLLVTAQRI